MESHNSSEPNDELTRHHFADSPERTSLGRNGDSQQRNSTGETRNRLDWREKLIMALITALIAVTVSTLVSSFWNYICPSQNTILNYTLEFSELNPPEGHRCLVWQFDIQPAKEWRFSNNEAWAFLNLEVHGANRLDQMPYSTLDFSEITEIRFYIQGNREFGRLDEFTVAISSYDLVYRIRDIPVSTRWSWVGIDLSQLEIAPWSKEKFGAGFEEPDLSKVVAFGFAVKSRGLRKQGAFALDDIVLIRSDGFGIQAEDFEVSQLSDLQSRNVSGRPASWVWGAAALH